MLLQLLLSQGDYQMIMNTLSGNLAEGTVESVAVETATSSKVANETTASIHHEIGKVSDVVAKTEVGATIWKEKIKEKAHIFLNFTFYMEQFIIDLFLNKEVSWCYFDSSSIKACNVHCLLQVLDCKESHSRDLQFARFVLQGLAIKGKIFTDNSMVTSVLLINCVLNDMRKGREDKLNRLLGRTQDFLDGVGSSSTSLDDATEKSMIDITYQQSGNDMFGKSTKKYLSLLSFVYSKILDLDLPVYFILNSGIARQFGTGYY